MRQQAIFSFVPRPTVRRLPASAARAAGSVAGVDWVAALRRRLVASGHRLLTRLALGTAVLLLALAGVLAVVRTAHAGRIYPAITVADVPVGGMTRAEAEGALRARAAAIEASTVAFSFGGHEWRATMRDLGVTADVEDALAEAYGIGREETAWGRLRSMADLVNADERVPLPVRLDHDVLARWFGTIDGELGLPPREAALAIDGTKVTIAPEVDGTVVDRPAATAAIEASLRAGRPLAAPLPTTAKRAAVRAGDLEAARADLEHALASPVQVTFNGGIWTLPGRELGGFVTQTVDPTKQGAAAYSLGLDRQALAAWLETNLGPEIDRDPKDAVVGWNGDHVVAVEPSVDGAKLQPDRLADLVAASFFGDHAAVAAPMTITKPTIDSNNLGALGIVTLLGTGSSNYSGSEVGRATNVEVGASLLNGTLVPPGGTFSFNNAIGAITEDKGFVEAQVIDGERIGRDIGGGICQVSTTVFRAAYIAGMPMTEWWPHRYRIPFYEMDGWPVGLDASILQPTDDPSTWADFKFENPSDHWLLVESWTNGSQVIVNIYGADLGWTVKSYGPTYGKTIRAEPDMEVVDPKLDPGTINKTESAADGLEVSYYRSVYDRDGNLLWERNFYTKYYPRGNVWQVSADMKGDSPADPNRPLPEAGPPPDPPSWLTPELAAVDTVPSNDSNADAADATESEDAPAESNPS